jgi:hypothetical protein
MKVKIIIKGLAGNANIEDRSKLDGIDCQDNFSEYFSKSFYFNGVQILNEQPLIDKNVSGGYMEFKYIDDKLYVIVKYNSPELLTEKEMDILISYTQGQLSDGIGEGFEQFPCADIDGEEIYLSPWYMGQKLIGIQNVVD